MSGRYVIVGNSGSGKSTLARRLSQAEALAHLDLDTVAWEPRMPPTRRPFPDSARAIAAFMDAHRGWVIEGCYADLAGVALPRCTRLFFLNPGVDRCIANARARPWEPHKYASKAEQDAMLPMLVEWIRGYETRDDSLSLTAHRALFDSFGGDKTEWTSESLPAADAPPGGQQ